MVWMRYHLSETGWDGWVCVCVALSCVCVCVTRHWDNRFHPLLSFICPNVCCFIFCVRVGSYAPDKRSREKAKLAVLQPRFFFFLFVSRRRRKNKTWLLPHLSRLFNLSIADKSYDDDPAQGQVPLSIFGIFFFFFFPRWTWSSRHVRSW